MNKYLLSIDGSPPVAILRPSAETDDPERFFQMAESLIIAALTGITTEIVPHPRVEGYEKRLMSFEGTGYKILCDPPNPKDPWAVIATQLIGVMAEKIRGPAYGEGWPIVSPKEGKEYSTRVVIGGINAFLNIDEIKAHVRRSLHIELAPPQK